MLVDEAESRYVVGHSLGRATADHSLSAIIPSRLEGGANDFEFAAGFIWSRFYPENWQWVDGCVVKCRSASAKANLLTALPFSPQVWTRAAIAGEDVSRLYWQRCRAFNPQLDSVDVETAVQSLIEHDRSASTLDLLSMALHNKRALSADTLLAPLECLLAFASEKAQDQFRLLNRHHIQDLIEAIQARSDIDQDRLIRIEWHFIRLLDRRGGHSPRTLQKCLSTSPQFFNEVLSCCYLSRKPELRQEGEPTEQQRYMAEHAYHLLHDWDVLPGTPDVGAIDEKRLREWTNEARRISEEIGRLNACDSHIGELFAKSKAVDQDGTWPSGAVRRIACEIGSESFASGMRCGILNLKGAGFRARGGDQERALAEEYEQKAEMVRFESPFVAQILDSVVESLERRGQFRDEQDRWES